MLHLRFLAHTLNGLAKNVRQKTMAYNQGCRSGSGPFSVEAEARKFYHFHIGHLT